MTAIPTAGYAWNFDPDRSDGGVIVDSVDGDMPEYRPGKSFSMDFVFWENTDDYEVGVAHDSGGTLGGAQGFTLGGATGATLGPVTQYVGHLDRYDAVREYGRWAGRYTLKETIDGTPRFSEHLPASATVDSIVVKLEPGDALDRTPGLWVVLDDVDDQTRFPRDMARVGLRFTVLARGDQYDTRSQLKNDLGSDLT